jgi:formylglycine-generating enzyme required for sulfatase activity
MAELMENFSGRSFGPYHIISPAGPHPLGRLYWARHHQLERNVQVLVPPAGSPHFTKAIRNYARLNHASIYSLYESIPCDERIFVALEPVANSSLLHFILAGEKPDLVSCARLASTLGSVLWEMESSSIPARLLSAYDYTLSTRGTPRLRNPAAYPGAPEATLHENSSHLASIFEPLLSESPQTEPLLKLLRDPGTSAFDLMRRTREFERQLAGVQAVHIRQEELEATQKAIRARIRRKWTIIIGSIAAVAFLALFIRVLYWAFVTDLPGKLGNESIPVPKGKYLSGQESIHVREFELDRHEVTIGQYEKFLNAMQSEKNWKTYLPFGTAASKTKPEDFQPNDWQEMITRARKVDKYNGQIRISRDTPVFGVDYPSAFAYAKWRGRRLPSKSEWIHAASGKDNLPYPWGTSATAPNINLGIHLPAGTNLGSYVHVLPAESVPDDTGPYQHRDLGGNLSEWIASPNPLEPLFIGGNYLDEASVSNSDAVRSASKPGGSTRIGFRTAK